MKKQPAFLQSPYFSIGLVAFLLTLVCGFFFIQIQTEYLNRSIPMHDPQYYSFYNAKLDAKLATQSRLALIWQEAFENPRHPLRTLPLLIFAPGFLASRMGHMATALPVFFVWLFLLGITLYKNTRIQAYALAGMLFFCAMTGLYQPLIGYGAYWLDLCAALLIASAILCLLNSQKGESLKWLTAFALMAALATLSRYVAVFYVVILATPILGYYLFYQWQQKGWLPFLKRAGAVAGVFALVAGFYLIRNLSDNLNFYATYSVYGILRVLYFASSLIAIVKAMINYSGVLLTLFLGGIFAVNLYGSYRLKSLNLEKLLTLAWISLILIFYLALIGAEIHPVAIFYPLPLIFFSIFALLPALKTKLMKDLPRKIAPCVLILLGLWVLSVHTGFQIAGHPPVQDRLKKNLNIQFAEIIPRQGKHLVWNCFFDEYTWFPAMEIFYRSHELYLPAGQDYFFSVNQAVFNGNFPGLTPAQVAPLIYRNALRWVDIAVVFENPQAASSRFNNPYTRTVAQFMSERLRQDQNHWQKIFTIQSPEYGTLAGYRNRLPQVPNHYQLLLSGKANVK